MRIKDILFEVRKNPAQNIKVPLVERLSKYKNDDNIYISFTRLDKIGINPKSSFDTPNGIYTYPLKEMWSSITSYDSISKSIPFASNNPFVWVLKSKKKLINLDHYKNLPKDLKNLQSIYDPFIAEYSKTCGPTEDSSGRLSNMFSNNNLNISDEQKAIEYVRNIDPKMIEIGGEDIFSFMFGKKLADAGYDFFEVKNIVQNAKEISRASTNNKNISNPFMEKFGSFDLLYQYAVDTATQKTPGGIFWNLTKILSIIMTKGAHISMTGADNGSFTQAWANLLRKLGYQGFRDSSGIIHPNEPIQAVFLSKSAFTVIDREINTEYSGSGHSAYKDYSQKIKSMSTKKIKTPIGEVLVQIPKSFNMSNKPFYGLSIENPIIITLDGNTISEVYYEETWDYDEDEPGPILPALKIGPTTFNVYDTSPMDAVKQAIDAYSQTI